MTGSLAAIVAGAVNSIISAFDQHASAAVQALTSLLNDVGLTAFAVCVGVAILRYRLYEIDRIISRTLAYAIVTGLLIGLYAGLVLLATRVLSVNSPVAVAAARWPPRPCSARCGAGRKRRWTAGLTGPGTTPKPPWPRSRPA